MKISCDACKTECTLTIRGPVLLRRALPKGWRPRTIDGRVYVLCDVCGNLRQFVGGLSPYLQGLLGLPPNVSIEFPEYDQLPDDWRKRKRPRAGAVAKTEREVASMVDINKVIAAGGDPGDTERAMRMNEIADWTEQRAAEAARAEGVELGPEHYEVLNLLRQHYLAHGSVWRARKLADMLETQFSNRGGRRHLYELFPRGPVTQGCRLAGLPKPADAEDKSFGSFL